MTQPLAERLKAALVDRYPAFAHSGVGKVGLSLSSADWRQIVEALNDADRLNWLEARAFTAYQGRDPETQSLEGHAVVVNEDLYERFEQRRGMVAPTLRLAIDTARKAVTVEVRS